MKAPTYISHLKQLDNGQWIFQSNEEHQRGVAHRAEQFAAAIGCGDIGRLLGLLHDLGKRQPGFQQYIRKSSGYDTTLQRAPRTPHAWVGAWVARDLYPFLDPLLSYPIVSHHSGMHDRYDFQASMQHQQAPEQHCWQGLQPEEVAMPPFMQQMQASDAHHFLRFLFSCLVDADYLDTEAFMSPETHRLRSDHIRIPDLLPLLEAYLKQLSDSAPPTALNRLRQSIQNICREKSASVPGFYSLTVPTGGGKTLSSLLWAICHAIKYNKKRIVIAIPYTSIIVQTAAILRRIFGAECVCEHHSAVDTDDLDQTESVDGSRLQCLRLATENWDYPIVVTTNVQLFESMFSNKPSACRKLHNLADSVLILDEVQTLPLDYLQPVVDALNCYQRLMGMTVLFTTASQPILEGTHQGVNPRVLFRGLSSVQEIIPTSWQLHEKLKRVDIRFDQSVSTYDEVAVRLSRHSRVLCIVNTRKDAAEIFSRLPEEGRKFHLSRRMCPAHIQQTLEEIRYALKNPEEKIIRVVSTQLIEAGVDIDFPVVYRQESGLDSILQAAGRCNREGLLTMGHTYVFRLDHPLPTGHLNATNEARRSLGERYDWFAPETLHAYFSQLYGRYSSFDKKGITEALQLDNLKFETAARDFKLIENKGINVIVNYGISADLVEKVRNNGFDYAISKKVSKFMVNINQQDFKTLKQGGLIEEILEGIFFLPDREQYLSDVGLTTENHWLDEILIQ